MHVLIFGGAGFVGLNLAERLLAQGAEATLFDRRAPIASAMRAFEKLPGRLRAVVGDVASQADIDAAFASAPSHVVYGAALTPGSAREAADPVRVLDVNLTGFVRALDAARKRGVRRVVNLSSAGAYGAAAFAHRSFDESLPADPTSLYSITKFASERAATRLSDLWRMDFRSVRLSAVFGPWEHDSGVRDTLSPPYQVARMALAGEPIVLPRPILRDWVYGPDVAEALVAVLNAPALQHQIYNVTPGAGWTLLEWAQCFAALRPGLVARLAAPGETPSVDPHSAGDRGIMSPARLAADTGFKARYDLAASFAHLTQWIDAHHDAWEGR